MDTEQPRDELTVLFALYLARLGGNDGAVEAEYLPEAHNLCEQGRLERRWFKGDPGLCFNNAALPALGIAALSASPPQTSTRYEST
jgi:hypothetical protein